MEGTVTPYRRLRSMARALSDQERARIRRAQAKLLRIETKAEESRRAAMLERDRQVAQLMDESASPTAIANELTCTRPAVYEMAKRGREAGGE